MSASKQAVIIRAPKDNSWFTVRRDPFQDRELSWEARGVLAYLLSRPDDWVLQPKDLQQGCGRDKVYSILKELKAARYLVYYAERDAKGQISRYVYVLHEMPVDPSLLPENPDAAKLDTGQPYTAKPELTEYRVLQNRESTDLKSQTQDTSDSKDKTLVAGATNGSTKPPKLEFFKTKYYPVNPSSKTIYLRRYDAGGYDHLLDEWTAKGVTPILGHLLNTDPAYADFKRVQPPRARNPIFDAVAYFLYPNLPENFDADALGEDGGYIGKVQKSLLKLLKASSPSKDQQKEIAHNISEAARRWKAAKQLHQPREVGAFCDWYFHCQNNPESADRQYLDAQKFANKSQKKQESPDEQAEFARKLQKSQFSRDKLAG